MNISIKRTLITGITYCIFFLIIILVAGSAKAQDKFVKTASELANLKKLSAAVEANPNNLEAHQFFINALKKGDPMLDTQYKIWIKRFSKSSTTPFAIGKMYYQRDDSKARDYLLQAAALKPDLSEAWKMLAIDAQRWGDKTASRKYFEKAKKADPQDPEYALQYALSFDGTEAVIRDSLLRNVAWRFPDRDDGAPKAICYLADYTTNVNEKLAYYEHLYSRYSDKQGFWIANGIANYFLQLLNTAPQKAFALAVRMNLEAKTDRWHWFNKIKVAQIFMNARELLVANRPAEAGELLKYLNLGSRVSPDYVWVEETLLLLKAEIADASNQTQAAYDSLALHYSILPNDRLRSAMSAYASKLGMDEKQVNSYIRNLRNTRAEQATDFSLEHYVEKGKVSLSDHKGKIILLTYWFPSCGPCRAEFPYFESVVRKFPDKELAYIAINLYPREDAYVIPFMKSTGYSFTSLRDDPNRDKGSLSAQGAPTNYLIDQKGRIIFSKFHIGERNERTLELMISELLKNED